MGLSIHYSGKIASPDLLPGLIEEIEDIAKVYSWKYTVYERHFPDNTFGKPEYNQNSYGICFTPHECETISIMFLSNGRMSDDLHLKFFGKTKTRAESEYLYMLSVKTQFAGVMVHQFIIQLFRYLNKKYFTDFTMKDESGFWETNDEAVLKSNFKKYNELIDGLVSAIEFFPVQSGETIETYLERLLKQINDKKKL